MNTKEIKQEIVNYGVSLSVLNANNIKTGLLSMNKINPLEKELLLPLSHDSEEILKEFVDAYEEHTKMRFEKYESGILFQYVFDRAVEVTYKVIMGLDIDTQYILNEPFDGYNIDIPEYIQLKLTNRVDTIIKALSQSATGSQDGGAAYKAGIVAILNTITQKEDFSKIESKKVYHGNG